MLLFLLLGCGENKTTDSADKTQEANQTLPLPTSGCGLPEYSFLPTTEMGKIVSIDHRPELSLKKDALISLVENFSFPLPPPQYDVQTYYIQYQTQDKGKEVLATGIISVPERTDSNIPILLWEHPTMGFADACAPTGTGVIGAAYPILFASLGMAVTAPDYIGMSGWKGTSEDLHPYIAGEPTAIASLDAIRALEHTLSREQIDLDIDTQKVVIWGASEGGYAALMSDRYLPYYAPEFFPVATVAAIPVTDPMALAQHGAVVLGPTTAGIMGSQITHNQWYQTDIDLSEIINPQYASMIEDFLYEECEDFNIFEGVTAVEDVFTDTYINGILSGQHAPWSCFLTENSVLGSPVPYAGAAPTLIITAEMDDLAIAEPVHQDIEEMCDLGYQIEHLQCAGLGHVDGAIDTLGIQWDWIQKQLQGEPLVDTCVVKQPTICPE